jgi:hypothetical protein
MQRITRACYFDLMLLQFNRGPFLLAEARECLGIDYDKWELIKDKFTIKESRYYNKRLQEEIDKRKSYCESKKKGAYAMHTHMHTEDEDEDENKNRIKDVIKEGMQGENKKEQRKIIPQLLEWVKKYCEERKNNIDAEYFVDSYIKNGWMVGKSKMKDWQATIRTWEKNGYNTGRSGTGQRQGGFGKSNAGRPGYDGSGNALGAAAKPGEFDEGIITLEGVPDHR